MTSLFSSTAAGRINWSSKLYMGLMSLDPEHRRELPKYLRIRELMEARIRSGEWKPGDQIPTLDELAATHSASLHIVRQAVGLLVRDRLLYRQQGAGTFVCTPGMPLGEVTENKHTLRIAEWMSTETAGSRMFEHIKSAYEGAFPPSVLINRAAPFSEYLDNLMLLISSGIAPDVAQVVSEWVPQLESYGALTMLDELLPKMLLDSHFQESGLRSGLVKGHLYALDWFPGPMLLFCNKALMKRAGLDPERPPETLDQFDYMVREIGQLRRNERGDRIYGFGIATSDELCEIGHLLPVFWSFGGELLKRAIPSAALNRGDRQALSWLAELAIGGHIPVGLTIRDTRELFASERVGFIIDGPWARGIYRSMNDGQSAADERYLVARIPRGRTGECESSVLNISLCLMRQSGNPRQAAAFIEYLASSRELAMWLLQDQGIIPADRELAHSIRHMDPYYATVVDQMETATAPYMAGRYSKAIERLLMEMINGIIVGEHPIDRAVETVIPAIEILMKAQA